MKAASASLPPLALTLSVKNGERGQKCSRCGTGAFSFIDFAGDGSDISSAFAPIANAAMKSSSLLPPLALTLSPLKNGERIRASPFARPGPVVFVRVNGCLRSTWGYGLPVVNLWWLYGCARRISNLVRGFPHACSHGGVPLKRSTRKSIVARTFAGGRRLAG